MLTLITDNDGTPRSVRVDATGTEYTPAHVVACLSGAGDLTAALREARADAAALRVEVERLTEENERLRQHAYSARLILAQALQAGQPLLTRVQLREILDRAFQVLRREAHDEDTAAP